MDASDPQAIVRAFLDAMGARELEQAKSMLAPHFWMEFPGPVRFTELEALIEWSKPRYRSIGKTYDRFESVPQNGQTENGPTVVWCVGRLHGQWPDGHPFSGIRFVDRFTVEHGKLVDQTVWNDLAETLRSD
ncbi:MAG: nuclear transport factor 2 family protein [Burkholderiaceae bacterium]